MSKRYEAHDCIGNVSDGRPHDIPLENPCTTEMFILVSVVNRDIAVHPFQTIEEAKKEMKTCFFATDGIEECLKAGDAFLGETSAWCNADGGDMQCDWDIFAIPKTR